MPFIIKEELFIFVYVCVCVYVRLAHCAQKISNIPSQTFQNFYPLFLLFPLTYYSFIILLILLAGPVNTSTNCIIIKLLGN